MEEEERRREGEENEGRVKVEEESQLTQRRNEVEVEGCSAVQRRGSHHLVLAGGHWGFSKHQPVKERDQNGL